MAALWPLSVSNKYVPYVSISLQSTKGVSGNLKLESRCYHTPGTSSTGRTLESLQTEPIVVSFCQYNESYWAFYPLLVTIANPGRYAIRAGMICYVPGTAMSHLFYILAVSASRDDMIRMMWLCRGVVVVLLFRSIDVPGIPYPACRTAASASRDEMMRWWC